MSVLFYRLGLLVRTALFLMKRVLSNGKRIIVIGKIVLLTSFLFSKNFWNDNYLKANVIV